MRIFWLLALVAAAVGGYYVYQHYYSPQSQMADGEVHWVTGKPTPQEKAAFDKENSGEGADGDSERKTTTARQAAATAMSPVASAPATAGNPIPASAVAANQPAAPAPAAPAPTTYATPAAVATPANLPMSDSQPANNPNGMRIGGNGTYQWYRQGNLTYRVDTTSGSSCIAYATMEEWRKQIVYSHGCGRGA